MDRDLDQLNVNLKVIDIVLMFVVITGSCCFAIWLMGAGCAGG